jgi:hypothetical protein
VKKSFICGRRPGIPARALTAAFIWGILLGVPLLRSQPIVANHETTDLSKISETWIMKAQSLIKIHYAHTSHGGQLVTGLKRLADPELKAYDPRLKVHIKSRALPDGEGLCLMDGQITETYITPELYWKSGGDGLTRQALQTYRGINVSMWAWCTQLEYYSEREVREYLETISSLENSFPRVRFVYFTGNAQATGAAGANRHFRNEQIREYCLENNKVLYDFADLDSWHGGEQATYLYDGLRIPVEHPFYHGGDDSHTTYASCENKGRALWWLLASLVQSDPLWAPGDCDCDGNGIVDKGDLSLKRLWMLAELTERFLVPGLTPIKKDLVLDRIDFYARRRALLLELRAWAVRCGLQENP